MRRTLSIWFDRLVAGLPLLRQRVASHTPPEPPRAAPPARRHFDGEATPLVEQMLAQSREALLLRPQVASGLTAEELQIAQEALDDAMAIVPQGAVVMQARFHDSGEEATLGPHDRLIQVDGYFLDRYAVTNHQFFEFVADGGYEQMSLWDESIWPAVLEFVDRTGQPGPRYWENGAFPTVQAEHPVVGVSWYEASAFARWAGKRLPTDAEWVKSAAWPVLADGIDAVQRRYPWGDAMDRKRANIWGSGFESTIPVHEMPGGAGVNGVQQLVGNVWEWTSTPFGSWEPAGRRIETPAPLKSIRGGAFDTYFDTQANCQFQSGERPLARKHNIGFRCALGFCDVVGRSLLPEGASTSDAEGASGTDAHAVVARSERQNAGIVQQATPATPTCEEVLT